MLQPAHCIHIPMYEYVCAKIYSKFVLDFVLCNANLQLCGFALSFKWSDVMLLYCWKIYTYIAVGTIG